MKISKKDLTLLFNLLKDCNLTLSEARKRDAVTRQIINSHKEYEEDRLKIVDKLCEKEDGKLIEKDNNYIVIKGKEEEFKKELEDLNNEEVEITLDAQTIKQAIEKTNYSPKVGEMEQIDNLIAKIK